MPSTTPSSTAPAHEDTHHVVLLLALAALATAVAVLIPVKAQ